MKKSPLLGLCPIGKFVFSHEDAILQKNRLQAALREWRINYIDLEGVIPDGLIREKAHIQPAVEHFRRSGANALFLPHCNFGTEGAAAVIARDLGLPTLLWGPRDEAPLADGTRLRDSLCGTFATSKVLHKLGVPFSYIENCRVDEQPLKKGVDRFVRAANVAAAFRQGIRIGHLGQRIGFFWTTIVNESELLERFHVEIIPLDMVEFIRHAKERVQAEQKSYLSEVRDLRTKARIEDMSDEQLANVLAVRDQLFNLAEKHNLDAFAIQDFMSLIEEMGAYCCYADSAVADRYAVGYESDIHGAISDFLLRKATLGEQPAFLTDLTVRHPTDDNAVLLWHFGAALSMRDPSDTMRLGRHWILPTEHSGMTHFRLKGGPVTIARFDGDRGQYQLAIGQGQTTDGPDTQNNYVWMKVDNWPHWERTLMEGPFIHHVAMTYGHFADVLQEATRFLPELDCIRLDRPE